MFIVEVCRAGRLKQRKVKNLGQLRALVVKEKGTMIVIQEGVDVFCGRGPAPARLIKMIDTAEALGRHKF